MNRKECAEHTLDAFFAAQACSENCQSLKINAWKQNTKDILKVQI